MQMEKFVASELDIMVFPFFLLFNIWKNRPPPWQADILFF